MLASTATDLNKSKYVRMMAFCSIDFLITVPFTIINLVLYFNTPGATLAPYTSWDDVHYGFDQVVEIPAAEFGARIPASVFHRFNLSRWSAPIAGIAFFLIFGLTEDARREYHRFWAEASKRMIQLCEPSRKSITQSPSTPLDQGNTFVDGFELHDKDPTKVTGAASATTVSSVPVLNTVNRETRPNNLKYISIDVQSEVSK